MSEANITNEEKEQLLFEIIEANKSFKAEEVFQLYYFILSLRDGSQK